MAGALQPRQAEYIGLIRQSGGHLHEVINEILDLAKIDAGKLDLYEEAGSTPATSSTPASRSCKSARGWAICICRQRATIRCRLWWPTLPG